MHSLKNKIRPITHHFNLTWLLLTVITVCTLSSGETITHYTSSTHCSITFTIQNGSLDTGQNHIFQKCEMSICRKYDLNGGCRQEDTYTLQESQCYWGCCRSDTYNWRQCEDYNEDFAVREQSSNRNVIIGLSISLSILLIAVLIFIVKYLKCCENKSEQLIKAKDQGYSQKQKETEWKKSARSFSVQNQECKLCHMKEAFVMHSCGAMFHLKCLPEIQENWVCKECSKPIQKLRLYCIVCLNRYITLKVNSFQDFQEKVKRSYQSHPENQCFDLMQVELDTERKLTATTNG